MRGSGGENLLTGRKSHANVGREISDKHQDKIILPCPDWARKKSTWTVISGDDTLYFVEASEERAVERIYAEFAFNPYEAGIGGDHQGDVTQREASFAKASAWNRGAKVVGGNTWRECHLDESIPETFLGSDSTKVMSVEEFLDSPSLMVIRKEELDEVSPTLTIDDIKILAER